MIKKEARKMLKYKDLIIETQHTRNVKAKVIPAITGRTRTISKSSRNYSIIYLFTAVGFLPGGSGYFTCKQNMKVIPTKFKSGGLHEKHVVATWNLGNHLSIRL